MLTSWSEQSTPAELSMASVLSRPPLERVGDAAALGHAQVGAFADHLAAQRLGVDAQGVVGAVADLQVALLLGLDVGADAAEPEQLDLAGQDRVDQLVGRHLVLGQAEGRLHLGRDRHRLGLAVEHAAALGDLALVVVLPTAARQREEPLALGEGLGRVGIGVDEDVQVVEGGDQPGVLGQQHAVAEDVARHVADADRGEVLALDVLAHLAEVALDRLPGAARGDAHRLVVVAGRAAGGEGVVQPEAVVPGHAVGVVGEGRRALVGGDHQVGVVAVVAHHLLRRHHLAALHVVGDVQQRADEGLVGGHPLGHEGLAPGRGRRQALGHEAALGADRGRSRRS